MFTLAGQVDKIDKDDETVAMPTARNYSPEEGLDSARGGRSSYRNQLSDTVQGRDRNNQAIPLSNSNFAMQTITQLAYNEQSSPSELQRLRNFNHARSSIQKHY